MMCACIGGLAPAFAGKVGKPIRVAKANTSGQTMRDDSALGRPLDARATNLLSTDTGGVEGSFSGRHNGLRDCIYDEAIRAGCAAHKEMELGTEHGLALKQAQFMEQQRRKARM